ncbi:MAG: DUF6893 family small protein [Thermomicrobiales bacterium]
MSWRIVLGVLMVLVGSVVVQSLPDIARYLKMRQM